MLELLPNEIHHIIMDFIGERKDCSNYAMISNSVRKYLVENHHILILQNINVEIGRYSNALLKSLRAKQSEVGFGSFKNPIDSKKLKRFRSHVSDASNVVSEFERSYKKVKEKLGSIAESIETQEVANIFERIEIKIWRKSGKFSVKSVFQ